MEAKCLDGSCKLDQTVQLVAEYRRKRELPPRPANDDRFELHAIAAAAETFGEAVDVDEGALALALHGNTGNPINPEQMRLYLAAQFALVNAAECENPESSPEKLIRNIGPLFAMVVRDLAQVERRKTPTGTVCQVVFQIGESTNLVLNAACGGCPKNR